MKSHTRLWIAVRALALALPLALLTACGSSTAPAGSHDTSPNPASTTSDLHTASTTLGKVLVNGAGMTVYFFDHDTPQEKASTCSGPCASLWPAVSTSSMVPTITGVTGTVGTITGVDGAAQVTLNGLPLYTYAADKNPGDVSGQGYGGIWWVIGADGAKVTHAPTVTPTPALTSAPAQIGSGY
ncbi:hypothetical protein [Specibacter sp. NPDC078709]|uniref:COG4315 family predicted lipoprotein n=1 Tax=unclassified Specibacter TaxID=3081321 RepID=UPI003444ED97